MPPRRVPSFSTIALPSRMFPVGSYTSPVIPLPVTLAWCRILMDAADHTNPNQHIEFLCDLSQDDGVTWAFWFGGGREGAPGSTTAGVERDIPGMGNPLRRGRVRVTVRGGPVRCAFTITGGS